MKKFISVFILCAVIITGFTYKPAVACSDELVELHQTNDFQTLKKSKVLSANTLQGNELTWWQDSLSKDKIISSENMVPPPCSFVNLYDNVNKITVYESCIQDKNRGSEDYYTYKDFEKLLNSAEETDDLGERILENYYLDLDTLDDTKYSVYFYENGVWLLQALPEKDSEKNVKLKLNQTLYNNFVKNLKQHIDDNKDIIGKVQWLEMLRVSSINELSITDSENIKTRTFEDIANYYSQISRINVLNKRVTKKESLPNATKVVIKLKNDIVFTVYINEESLLLNSSHSDLNLIYDMENEHIMDRLDDVVTSGKIVATAAKPIIYLYPEEKTDCTVKIGYPSLTYTYPTYNDGWNVTAYPDGKLINKADGSEHYYLFWEGNEVIDWDYSKGFCVKGSDTEKFLKEKLSYMGLTPREYNDFITYWVPRMKYSKYNLITFSGEQYENLAPLKVTPQPDSILRINMVFKNLEKPIKIQEQKLKPFERKGFTVVEWGGTDDNK